MHVQGSSFHHPEAGPLAFRRARHALRHTHERKTVNRMKPLSERWLHGGSRLALRNFTLQDLDAVHAYAADPLVCRHVDWGPNSRADTEAFINEAMASAPGALNLAVILDNEVIGAGAVWATNGQHACGELGYVLNSACWGRGYATVVAGFLLELGFGALELQRIEATCAPENAASRRVLEKSGFSYEGLLRGHKRTATGRRDSLLFAKLATD